MKKTVLSVITAIALFCVVFIAAACGQHVCSYKERYVEATCESQGYVEKVCTICGAVEKDYSNATPALGHDMKTVEEKAATCYEAGYSSHERCSRCGITEGKTDYSARHDFVFDSGKAATCTEDGYSASQICRVCGYVEGKIVIKAGHRMVTMQEKKAECCVDGYSQHLACALCGYTEGKTVFPAEHEFVETAGKAATCTDKGYTDYLSCVRCGFIKDKEEIPYSHEWETVAEQAATCTEDGYSEYSVCSLCGAEQGKTVYPARHYYEFIKEKPATCTEDGYSEYRKCTVCGEEKDKEILGAHHEMISVAGLSATCLEDGYTAHQVCTVCGYTKYKTPIKARHYMVEVGEAKADCYHSGHSAYKLCSVCGYTEGKVIIAASHDLYDVSGKAATCTEDGYSDYKACRKCAYTEGKNVVKAHHDFLVEPGKAATCTEDGYTEYKRCLVCGYVQDREIIKAQHKMVFVESKPASCVEDGYSAHRACSVCGYTEGKTVITGGGHIYYSTPGKAPTCTEDGYTAYKKCIKCGVIEGKITLPAAHDFVTVEEKPATCTEDGYSRHTTCRICGIVENKEILPATGHDMIDVQAKSATCTEDGYSAHKACSNCGITECKTTIKATGHKYGQYTKYQDATCLANATETAACTECGNVDVREIEGTQLSHEYYKNAALNNNGKLAYLCSLCETIELREPARVIILAGQSNAVGQSYAFYLKNEGSPVSAEQYALYTQGFDGTLIYYNNCEGIADEYKHTYSTDFVPVRFGQGVGVYDKVTYPEGAFGPEMGIAKYWQETYPDEKLYIIKYAYGGTALYDRWRSPSSVENDANGGTTGDLYTKTVGFVNNGIKLLEDKGLAPQLEALVWMQGESDNGHYYTYYERYAYFAEDMRADLGAYATDKGMAFIDGGISQNWSNYEKINSIKEDYSLYCNRNYYVDTVAAGLTFDKDNTDYAHYDAAAMLELGGLFGEKVVEAITDNEKTEYNTAFYKEGVMSESFAGTGTEDDPYILETAADWALFAKQLSGEQTFAGKYFKMTRDVYLTHYKFNPIGVGQYNYNQSGTQTEGGFFANGEEKVFAGTLEGNGKTVHVRFYRQERNVALFKGLAPGGVIKNLNVTGDVYITDGTKWIAAGIVGYNSGTLENCTNYVDVTAFSRMAGVAARNVGTIINCNNYGSLLCSSTTCMTGGIVGEATAGSVIKNCKNFGTVTGKNYVGGIVGSGENGEITDCENNGKINGQLYTAGICAAMSASAVVRCLNRGEIVFTGDLPSANSVHQNVGGICGYANQGSEITDCRNYADISGENLEFIVGGIAAHVNASAVSGCVNEGSVVGSNKGTNLAMRGYIGGVIGWAENASSVTDSTNLGSVINVLYRSGGVVGYLKNSSADGLTNGKENAGEETGKIVFATSSTNRTRNGGVIGELYNSVIGNESSTEISNRNYGTLVNMHMWNGCVIGLADSSRIYGCENSGVVVCLSTAYDIGGIVGHLLNVNTVKYCVNNGAVSAKYNVGGIVGNALDSTVIDCCVNNGKITSSDSGKSGAISGNGKGQITGCTDNSAA